MQRFIDRAAMVLAVCLVAGLFASNARAELRIDITKGVVEPIPIAVTDMVGPSGEPSQYGADISRVIAADLERSGLFKALDRKAFIQQAGAINTLPRFGDWRVINAQALVQGRAHLVTDGRLRVEFRLWDVLAEQQMVGL
ncbi:MAG: Tol-Pal system protein TolB, partial [Rhodospirillaceae bacterium]